VFRETVREAQQLIARHDQLERHATLPVRVPSDDDEARRLCNSVLHDDTLGGATSIERALAQYMLWKIGACSEADAASETKQAQPSHDGRPGRVPDHPELRLSNRTIARALMLPLSVRAALPMAVQMMFVDGHSLVFEVARPLRLVDSEGRSVVFPRAVTTDEIDAAIAAGVKADPNT